ncbi:MAG: response regulator [Acidobacteria bacterium]|nr:MAG: response regulator [Acidobacteriota bacterium]
MPTAPVRVLLVEDSPSDAQLLQEHLLEVGFERFRVTHVERLQDALTRLSNEVFDVVLLDLTLPDSSGLDTFSRIHSQAPDIPLVVLTSITDQDLAIEAVRHGVQDYLIKGQADARLIARAIRYAIERQDMERDLRRSQERYRRLADELEGLVEARTSDLRQTMLAVEQRTEQLRSLATQLGQAEERERRRLAQAIHDHLQQLLVAAKFHVGRLSIGVPVETSRQIGNQLEQILSESIEATRSLTFELSPPILYERGLVAALEWLGDWVRSKHNLAVTFKADGEADPENQDMRILLFQATRELLFNVVKHARVNAAEVEIRLVDGAWFQLLVTDQGIGFDSSSIPAGTASPGGFGLFSIRERLGLIGGKMEVDSAPGRGSRFTLTVPRGTPGSANPGSPVDQSSLRDRRN